MAVLVQDSFTDTNGTSLDAHTPDVRPGSNAWSEDNGDFQISGNRAAVSVAGTYRAATIDCGESDLTLSVVANSAATINNPARLVGLIARFTDVSNYWIIGILPPSNSFGIYERAAGTTTGRATTSVSLSTGVDYTIEVELNGQTITARLNGGNEVSYNAASLNETATRHGLACQGTGDSLDDFLAETAGSPISITGAGGIASAEAFGVPAVSLSGGAQTISGAGGIASAEAFGIPAVSLSAPPGLGGEILFAVRRHRGPRFKLIFRSPAGAKFAEVGNFDWLSCYVGVNQKGLLRSQLSGVHRAIAGLEHRSQIELWWKDDDFDIGWQPFFGGLYLDEHRERQPLDLFQLSAPGWKEMLAWRIVNWPAKLANRTMFTNVPAETIMKTLVTYNATASATVAAGRKREGAIGGATITVQADGGGGASLPWNCFSENLLGSLQRMAPIAGGDFDLVKTAAATWDFRWYLGQLGQDRTSTVRFSIEAGNLVEPVYDRNRLQERTVAAVWGQGEDAERDYAERTGADYAADNDKEIYVDARDVDKGDVAGLQARGDQRLEETRVRAVVGFRVRQTPGCKFMVHYGLGDLVTLIDPFTGASGPMKVTDATLGLGQDGESVVDVEVRTP